MQAIVIELFIPGELKDEPVICEMVKSFDVNIKIIEASFSSESGWAILAISGGKQEIDRMFAHLRAKGITVETR